MVFLNNIEITLRPDSSEPPTYEELHPTHPDFRKHNRAAAPDTFAEYDDPDNWNFAPTNRYKAVYVEVPAYGARFGIDITIAPRFTHCGWNRVKFDVFLQGRMVGFVLTREELFRAQGLLKLRLGAVLPQSAVGQGLVAAGAQKLIFADPGNYLSSRQSNAGTVTIQVRYWNEQPNRTEVSSMVQTFVWRYRTSEDMFKYNIWNKIIAARPPDGAPSQNIHAPVSRSGVDSSLAPAVTQQTASSSAPIHRTQPQSQNAASPDDPNTGNTLNVVAPTGGPQAQLQSTVSTNQQDHVSGSHDPVASATSQASKIQQNVEALTRATYDGRFLQSQAQAPTRATYGLRFFQSLEQLKAALAADQNDSNEIEGMKGQRRSKILIIEKAFNQQLTDRNKQFLDLELTALEREILGTNGTDVAQLWKTSIAVDAIRAARSAFAALR
ncbi:uncharacterized protein AB675_5885 [Cyphellophora attinorum]|uniref:Uncharacterized protein n=1 Tax=Cyphellophora attinorum TaxID=1664694 RepID=A0A0N0NL33_9EURO|nr:uncharacterized protein AB675_5885 [Phialophora attinorum]KPI38718.1 hypothetical protein AB675_5885 [Phialophora attinorum]